MNIFKKLKTNRKLNIYLKERKQFDKVVPIDKFLEMKESDVIKLCQWVQANNYTNSTETIIKIDSRTSFDIMAKNIFKKSYKEISNGRVDSYICGYRIDINRVKEGFVVITTI